MVLHEVIGWIIYNNIYLWLGAYAIHALGTAGGIYIGGGHVDLLKMQEHLGSTIYVARN
jgi:hypothetical protein